MMFQYYIKIVPTMLEKETGDLIFSNQFSVTRHQKSVSACKKKMKLGNILEITVIFFSERRVRNAWSIFQLRTFPAYGEIYGEDKVNWKD